MRWFFILLAALLWLAPDMEAGEGKVVKVLSQLLDKQGHFALSPSLYERDAYQFRLRKSLALRGGARLVVQWKAKKADWSRLTLRAEIRSLLGDSLHTVTLEQAAVKNGGLLGNWSEFRIEGADYKNFGDIVAWRVTLLEAGQPLGQLESFLWSPAGGPPPPQAPGH